MEVIKNIGKQKIINKYNFAVIEIENKFINKNIIAHQIKLKIIVE